MFPTASEGKNIWNQMGTTGAASAVFGAFFPKCFVEVSKVTCGDEFWGMEPPCSYLLSKRATWSLPSVTTCAFKVLNDLCLGQVTGRGKGKRYLGKMSKCGSFP